MKTILLSLLLLFTVVCLVRTQSCKEKCKGTEKPKVCKRKCRAAKLKLKECKKQCEGKPDDCLKECLRGK